MSAKDDRDPTHFKLILNFLRGNEKTVLEDIGNEPWTRRDLLNLKDEVTFYRVESLRVAVNKRLSPIS